MFEWNLLTMEIISRSRVSFHLFSNVSHRFIIMINDPGTTQRDTKVHRRVFPLTRFEIDIIRDTRVLLTIEVILYPEDYVLYILWNYRFTKFHTCNIRVVTIKNSIFPIFTLFHPKIIFNHIVQVMIYHIFKFFRDDRVIPRCDDVFIEEENTT